MVPYVFLTTYSTHMPKLGVLVFDPTHDLSLALHGHVIQDTKHLASSFVSHRFSHVRRQGNNVAHALARWAINSPNFTIWMEDVPPDIQCIVQADLAFFS